MKLRKWLPLLLVIVTSLVAVIYISGRETVPEGTLAVDTKGETVYVSLAELTAEEISATLTDAKGEEHSLEAKGVWLSAVLEAAGVDMRAVSQVTVLASDEYSATVTGEELRTDGKVCLLLEGDEAPELVVLVDPNRKRNVSSVERITVD